MKKQTIIALAVIGVLLVATIGATFAYFASSSQNDNAGINAETEELGSILLDGTKVFTSYDLLPGQMGVQEFTIEKNSDTGNGIYEIDLEANVPEEFRSDIEILLYKTTDLDTNNVTVNVADPSNYVSFNGELWRIIGAFNNIDDGTDTKETRLKIIRDKPYSESIAWDTDNVNDWTTASLQEELNTTYLNSIQSPYKEMIGNAKWNLGGNDVRETNAKEYYTRERGTTVYSGRPTEWIGKIALIYPSDYGYATSGGRTSERSSCLETDLYPSYPSECYNNSWLYDSTLAQWTLTPDSTDLNVVFSIGSAGLVYSNIARSTIRAVFPVLYLSSNVKITGGDGSESNPFTLSL